MLDSICQQKTCCYIFIVLLHQNTLPGPLMKQILISHYVMATSVKMSDFAQIAVTNITPYNMPE